MTSRLLLKKLRLVDEAAAKICAVLEPSYTDSLVRCLKRLDILSIRYLASRNLRVHFAPQEVALVSELARPFGWAVWLAILTDTRLDDPDWILAGLHKGAQRWGFTEDEGRQWRKEYIRAHLEPSSPPAHRVQPGAALETLR
ncbi:MAG: hypothetical protein V3U98_00720 [Acidobacteriota bacterium]